MPTGLHLGCVYGLVTVKLCLDCPDYAKNRGARCQKCERAHTRRRNQNPKRAAYADPIYRAYVLEDTCYLCGLPATADDPMTRDHVVPLAVSGGLHGANDYANLKTAHRSCNASKGAKQ